jgi:hypothetical protein
MQPVLCSTGRPFKNTFCAIKGFEVTKERKPKIWIGSQAHSRSAVANPIVATTHMCQSTPIRNPALRM